MEAPGQHDFGDERLARTMQVPSLLVPETWASRCSNIGKSSTFEASFPTLSWNIDNMRKLRQVSWSILQLLVWGHRTMTSVANNLEMRHIPDTYIHHAIRISTDVISHPMPTDHGIYSPLGTCQQGHAVSDFHFFQLKDCQALRYHTKGPVVCQSNTLFICYCSAIIKYPNILMQWSIH